MCHKIQPNPTQPNPEWLAQLAGAVEYTDCPSAEE